MSEQEKQENQKTIVAFAAGLLIGGLLVWIFGGTPDEKQDADKAAEQETATEVTNTGTTENTQVATEEKKPEMQVGAGSVEIKDQAASKTVAIDSATFPADEGWIGVRDYADGKTGYILGVARFSKEQGLIPAEVALQRSTIAGKEYAVVFFKESGDRKFNAAVDTQLEGVVKTFKAN
jgi:hypothetical protein